MPASSTASSKVRQATAADADILAVIHAACFAAGWDASAFATFLAAPNCLSLVATPAPNASPRGLLVARIVVDEAELLTLGVVPDHRRQGVARALLLAAMTELRCAGARRLVLEVADGNDAALGLYRSLGATPAGGRPHYYAEGADATIFSLAL